MVTENKKLQQWVDDKIKLCQPDDVVWCDGSEEEWSRMWDILVKGGASIYQTDLRSRENELNRQYRKDEIEENRQLRKNEKRSFNNTYEQTKFEAELLFSQIENIPYTIYRPSIVSGNSVTGNLAASSIIYKFIILLSRNLLCKLPIDSDASLNIIPVNNFVNKMLAIGSQKESIGKTYHLTHQKNTEFRALLEQACSLLNVEPPEFVSRQQIEDIPNQIMQHIEVFMPYIRQSQKFEFQTEEGIKNLLPPCDNVISTLHNIIHNFSSSKK